MLLKDKVAVVYGGGGAIGGAAARAFAREGAHVFLAGRTRERLQRVADDIAAAGGQSRIAVLDALDEGAVRAHADAVIWWQETPSGRPFRVLDWDPSPWRDARAD